MREVVRSRRPVSRWIEWGLPARFALIGSLSVYWPSLLSGFGWMQADPGDTRLVHYFLEHGWRWLQGAESLWDMPQFFPHSNTGAYSDILVGALPHYALLRAIGLGSDLAYGLWAVSSLILCFGAMVYFLRRFFSEYLGWKLSSWQQVIALCAGAYLFAFGAPRAGQTPHPQLFSQYLSVFALVGGLEMLRGVRDRQKSRLWIGAAALGFFATAQIWASFYLGWFLCFGLMVWGVVLFFVQKEACVTFLKQAWAPLIGVGALSGLALLPLVWHYRTAAQEVGVRLYSDVLFTLPRPQSLLFLGGRSLLYRWELKIKAFRVLTESGELAMGIGLLTLVLVIYGFWRVRGDWRLRALAWASLSVVLLSLSWPRLGSLWWGVFTVVPGADAIRAVARIGLLLLIPASIGLALALARLRLAPLIALVFLVLLEQVQGSSRYEVASYGASVDRIARAIVPGCRAFYAAVVWGEQEPGEPELRFQIDAILASQRAGVPTVNGYSGNQPPGYEELGRLFIRGPGDRRRLKDALRRWALAHGVDPQTICWIEVPSSELPGRGVP